MSVLPVATVVDPVLPRRAADVSVHELRSRQTQRLIGEVNETEREPT